MVEYLQQTWLFAITLAVDRLKIVLELRAGCLEQVCVIIDLLTHSGQFLEKRVAHVCDFKARAHERIADFLNSIAHRIALLVNNHIDAPLRAVLNEGV